MKQQFLLKSSSFLVTSVILGGSVPQSVSANGLEKLILYMWSLFLKIFETKSDKIKKSGEKLAKFFIEKMETELKEYSKCMKYDKVKEKGERFIESFLKETEKNFKERNKNVEYDKIEEEGKKLIESFLEEIKKKLALDMKKIEKDKKQLAELCEKLQLESRTDDEGNVIIKFDTDPKKFQPKFYARSHSASGNGYYPVHKIVYDVSGKKLFMYSLGDNFGEHPMRLGDSIDCLTVEQYAQMIFDEYKIFETNPMGKVKEGLKEFFKNINWSKNKKENNDRVCKGTVNVQGVDFPISLSLKMDSEEQFYCEVDFVKDLSLNCNSFGTKENDELTCLANRLAYCVSQLKKLENTGKFEKVFFDAENGHLVISLKEGCAVRCEGRYPFEESSNINVIGFNLNNGCAYTLKDDDYCSGFSFSCGTDDFKEDNDFVKEEKNRLEKFIDSICKKFSESNDSIDVSVGEWYS